MPWAAAAAASRSSRTVPRPLPWNRSSTANAASAAPSLSAKYDPTAMGRSSPSTDRRATSVSALAGSCESLSRSISESAGSAMLKKRRRLDRQIVEEAAERVVIRRLRRPDGDHRSVAQHRAVRQVVRRGQRRGSLVLHLMLCRRPRAHRAARTRAPGAARSAPDTVPSGRPARRRSPSTDEPWRRGRASP